MPIGPAVRRLLGPLEPKVARLYRDAFFDVGAFARAVRSWTDAARILEVGCGDGLATEERDEVRRLRREVRQLREERAILSKAAAWFARETNAIPSKDSSS